MREILKVRYLGSSDLADVFVVAFKLPNSLRKIFAEGALSVACIPTFVDLIGAGKKKEANSLMTLAFLGFEGALLALIAIVCVKAEWVVWFASSGSSPEKLAGAAALLRILMPIIFFLSVNSLLSGAFQAIHHFLVPALSPVLLNVVFIGALFICWQYHLPVEYLCYLILFGSFLQFVLHLMTYWRLGFRFGPVRREVLPHFIAILKKFVPSMIGMGILEINLFADTAFASYLPSGSQYLIDCSYGFLRIPLGVLAVAFSTVLLPHFSQVRSYAPKRLSFYLLESTKFVAWVMLPATFIMMFFAQKIFLTLFYSAKFPLERVFEAQFILIAYLFGLFFFSLNKVLVNIFYALHETRLPTVVVAIATAFNIGLNWLLLDPWGTTGIALATSLAGVLQTLILVALLYTRFDFKLFPFNFWQFFWRYALQLLTLGTLFCVTFKLWEWTILHIMPMHARFLLTGLGFWLWSLPLVGFFALGLMLTRRHFGVSLYFAEQ